MLKELEKWPGWGAEYGPSLDTLREWMEPGWVTRTGMEVLVRLVGAVNSAL